MSKIIDFIKFVRFANSVRFNLNNHSPIEALAFQTVAAIKLSRQKNFTLTHNALTTYDSIIFTLFVLRIMCITGISNRENAEEFSNMYINKVLSYFPERNKISKKYDLNFFENRVKYYDSLLTNVSGSADELLDKIVTAFESIITYDYFGKYVRFNESTPPLIIDFFEKIKISTDVKSYYSSFDSFFYKLLQDIYELYN